jgi:hypothetical protein
MSKVIKPFTKKEFEHLKVSIQSFERNVSIDVHDYQRLRETVEKGFAEPDLNAIASEVAGKPLKPTQSLEDFLEFQSAAIRLGLQYKLAIIKVAMFSVFRLSVKQNTYAWPDSFEALSEALEWCTSEILKDLGKL